MKTLDQSLRDEYEMLFDNCHTRPNHVTEVKSFINQLMKGIVQYEGVTGITKVPWFIVGMIHGMECSFSFNQHLHNGDSLNHRTVHEPSGRPKIGNPPFLWNVSAVDALQYDRFTAWNDWTIAGICFMLESYNGWGYRSHHINSPYLWSYSNNYEQGKFVEDGIWNDNAISKQVGAVTALKQMVADHLVSLPAREV